MNDNVEGGITFHDDDGRVIASEFEPAYRVGNKSGDRIGTASVEIRPADRRAEEIEAIRAEIERVREKLAAAYDRIAELERQLAEK